MARIELPKLVATDLDGTLVRSDETVSDYSLAVLRKVREAGVTLVGVTGRGPRLIELCRRDLPVADLFVMANGAYVLDQRDPDAVRVLRRERLPGPDLAEALRRIEGVAGPLSVLVEALEDPRAPLWGDSHVVWPYPEWVPYDRAEALAGPVYKGFASAPHLDADELLALAAEVVPPELATITQSGLGYIELTAPGVDKATGLAVVAEELGIDLSGVRAGENAGKRAKVMSSHPPVRELFEEERAYLSQFKGAGKCSVNELKRKLQDLSDRYLLIVRTEQGLNTYLREVEALREQLRNETAIAGARDLQRTLELDNLLETGRLMASAALLRKESRGSHYREDYPAMDPAYDRNIIADRNADETFFFHKLNPA